MIIQVLEGFEITVKDRRDGRATNWYRVFKASWCLITNDIEFHRMAVIGKERWEIAEYPETSESYD